MAILVARLPESLHKHLRELARRENVSMSQFITLAVAEKMAALEAEETIQQRAARASREAFERALAKVPDVGSAPEDALQETRMRADVQRATNASVTDGGEVTGVIGKGVVVSFAVAYDTGAGLATGRSCRTGARSRT